MADIAAEMNFSPEVDVEGEGSNASDLSSEFETVEMLSYLMLAVGIVVLTALGILRAPYGAFSSSKWGPTLNARVAWMVQECPSACLPVAIMWAGGDSLMLEMDVKAKVLGAAFLAHYMHRSFLFPLVLRPSERTPMIVSLLAFLFTSLNALLQASMWLQHQHWHRVGTGQFWVGMSVWVVGACTNIHSDYHLIELRKNASMSSTGRWQVPRQGIFNYVSGGSYFAEIVEWLGYCIAANHIAAFAFLGFVICNIGPRAFHYHQLYLQLFPDYPKNRKALIPGLL